MSGSPSNFRIIFFDGAIGNPPAKSVKKITAQSVVSATLNWSVKPEIGVTFNDIRFNGAILSVSPDGGVDVTQHILANGNNTVELNYSRWLNWFLDAGTAYVTLDVVAQGVGQKDASELFNFSNVKTWVYVGVVVLVLVIILWWLMRTSTGGRVVSAAYGTGRDIYHKLGGA